MEGVGSTNPITHITFRRNIAQQVWIEVFKRDVEECLFWSVQSEAPWGCFSEDFNFDSIVRDLLCGFLT